MDSKRYSIDEIVDATALSEGHLTRLNGPLDRIAQTYYWIDDIVGPSRKDCSEFGLECLQNYLSQVGKKGDGTQTYTDWQQEIWQRYERADALEASTGLVPIPKIEIVDRTPALANLEASIGNFNRSLENFDAYFDAIGEQIGNRAVTRVAVATKKSIDNGLTQLLTNISKIGGN